MSVKQEQPFCPLDFNYNETILNKASPTLQ